MKIIVYVEYEEKCIVYHIKKIDKKNEKIIKDNR